jgi:hypothetical protein
LHGILKNINKKAPSSKMVLLFGGSIKRARHEVGDMKDHNIFMENQTAWSLSTSIGTPCQRLK